MKISQLLCKILGFLLEKYVEQFLFQSARPFSFGWDQCIICVLLMINGPFVGITTLQQHLPHCTKRWRVGEISVPAWHAWVVFRE